MIDNNNIRNHQPSFLNMTNKYNRLALITYLDIVMNLDDLIMILHFLCRSKRDA